MNSRKNKIALIKALKSGQIKPEEITTESVIVADKDEAFSGLMIAVANKQAGKKSPVVFIGEPKAQIETCFENVMDKRNHKIQFENGNKYNTRK